MCAVIWIITLNLLFGGVIGITVTMNHDITGTAGENGTSLECSYTKENVKTIDSVVIEASINKIWQKIINFPPGHPTLILDSGSYLVERVTFNNLTQESNKAMLIFNKLLCEDETDYKCFVGYTDIKFLQASNYSESTRIRVQVLPSKPSDILVFLNSTSIDYTTHLSATNFGQTTALFRNDTENEQMLAEGNLMVIICSGEIGNPPENLTVQRVLKDRKVSIITALDAQTIHDAENCTYYQNSSFAVNLTAEDNGAVFRCAVTSFIHDDGMSIKTGPIDVKYQVRQPEIHILPKDHYTLPITLDCRSTGNPEPVYTWYRITNTSQPDNWVLLANNTRNVTLTNITDLGLYRCNTSNTIGMILYRKSRTRNINLRVMSTTTETYSVFITVPVIVAVCLVVAALFISYKKRRNFPSFQRILHSLGVDNNGYVKDDCEKRNGRDIFSGQKYAKVHKQNVQQELDIQNPVGNEISDATDNWQDRQPSNDESYDTVVEERSPKQEHTHTPNAELVLGENNGTIQWHKEFHPQSKDRNTETAVLNILLDDNNHYAPGHEIYDTTRNDRHVTPNDAELYDKVADTRDPKNI